MAQDLPPELAAALRPVLPELAQDIIEAIGREVPDYARPLEGPVRPRAARRRPARARALRRRHRGPAAGDGGAREIYVELGRGEMRGGRSLDALLSAYRLGARLAWERFVAAGEAAGHEPRTLYRLASAIFDYIDGISAESVEGFAEERAAAEGERQRRRRALARLLARDDVAARGDPRPRAAGGLAASRHARRAGRGRRRRRDEPDADRLASRLGAGAIAAAEGALAIAWVPDPEAPGRRAAARVGARRRARRAGARAGARARRAQPRSRPRRARPGARRPPRRRPARRGRRAPPRAAPARRRRRARRRPRGARPRAARRAAPRRPRAPARDPARLARPPRTGHARGRASSTSTRRPCATASRSCASCSASASTTPTRASSSRSRCAPSPRRPNPAARAARRRRAAARGPAAARGRSWGRAV